jgi:hypothetical protein
MADLVFPHTFADGAGNTASGAQVMANLNAAKTKIDASTTGLTELASTWRVVAQAGGQPNGMTAGLVYLPRADGAQMNVSGIAVSLPVTWAQPFGLQKLLDVVPTGRTVQARMQLVVAVNGTAPGVTISAGLYPVTAAGGAGLIGLTAGTLKGSSAGVAATSPNSVSQATGPLFALSAGDAPALYVIGFTASTWAGNTVVVLGAELQSRYV